MELTIHAITLIGLMFVVSIVAGGLSPRLGVPTLLIFVAIGMLAGENGPGGIVFDDVQLAHLAGSAALALIIFDGGTRTDLASFKLGFRPAAVLATLGVLLTAGITGLACVWLLDIPPLSALLIGALVSSTDAAAVFALLKYANLSLHPRVGATLEIESGSNDPMAVFLTIVLLEAVLQDRLPAAGAFLYFIQQMGLGLIGGYVGGWLLARGINRLRLNAALYPLLAVFGALLIFGAVSLIDGSGFLAVYIAGLFVGNTRLKSMGAILGFNDGIAWLAQIGMFLILGLLVTPAELVRYAIPALIISTVLILVARPVAVWLCLIPFRFGWRETTYISWVGLRGAVPIVLAMFPLLAGVEHAAAMFNVAFFMVLISLIVQGTSVAPVARWLGLEVRQRPKSHQRIELDVPGQQNYEIVGYHIEADSMVANRSLVSLPLPGSVRFIGILRRGLLVPKSNRMRLKPGDHLYLLAPIRKIGRLDYLFLTRSSERPEALRSGEFDITGDVRMTDLLLLLGIEAPEGFTDETVQQWFERKLGVPQESRSLDLDSWRITATRVAGGRITAAHVTKISTSRDETQ